MKRETKKYQKAPDVPKRLNSDGRDAFLRYCRASIDRDSLVPMTVSRAQVAGFIEQQMTAIEKKMNDDVDPEKMKLYLELSQELREIRNEIFQEN